MAGFVARGIATGVAEGLGAEAGSASEFGTGVGGTTSVGTTPGTLGEIAPGFPGWKDIGRGAGEFFSGDIFKNTPNPTTSREISNQDRARAENEYDRVRKFYIQNGQVFNQGKTARQSFAENPIGGVLSFLPDRIYYVDRTKPPFFKTKTLDVIGGGKPLGGSNFNPKEPDYGVPPGLPMPNPPVPGFSPPTPGGSSTLGKLPSGILPSQDVHRKHLAGRLSQQQLDALMASEAYEKNRQNHIAGFRYDPTLSDNRVATYFNPTTKKAYVSYRGTAELGDAVGYWPNVIKGDLSYTERMKQAIDYHDRVKKKYGVNARVTGHSLGGSIAQVVARERGADGAGFNQGATLFGTDKELAGLCSKKKPPPICDRFVQHRIFYDVVSKSATKAKTSNRQFGYNRIPGTNVLNAHFMSNFTDPKSQYWQTHRVRSIDEIQKEERGSRARRRRRGGR